MKLVSTLQRNLRGIRWLWSQYGDLIRAEKRPMGLASLAMAGEILFLLLVPWPIKYVTDGLLIPNSDVSLWGVPSGYPTENPGAFVFFVSAALVAIVLLGQFCAYHRKVLSATAGQHMVLKVRKRLFEHLQRLPLSFHDRSRQGDLILRLTGDVPILRDVLSESLLELVGRLVTALAMVGIMFWVDAGLACVAVGTVLILAVLSGVFTTRMARIVRKQRKKESAVAFATGESLRAIKLVKASSREAEVTRRFARQNRSSLRAGIKGTRLQASLARWVEVLFAIGTACVLGIGVLRVQSDMGLSAGDLLMFLSYVRHLNKPIRKSARMTTRIGKAVACGERLIELLKQPPERVDRGAALPQPISRIAAEDLHFAYADQAPVLRDVRFEIHRGESIAIVGRNGAGKSTLVNLMLRLYEPSRGAIYFDQLPLDEISLQSIRSQFTLAPQEAILFGDTLGECLEFIAPDSSQSAMTGALQTVGARHLLDREGGLDAPVAEGGKDLSGGERRKVVLAAASLRSAPFVILDEPTTHIDEASRRDLLERLPQLFGESGLLVVSHDPELVAMTDRVLYLDGGRVAASGRHDELLELHEGYRDLFAAERKEPSCPP